MVMDMKVPYLFHQWLGSYGPKLGASFALLLALWWLIPRWLVNFPELAFADVGVCHLLVLGLLLWMLSQWLGAYAFGRVLANLGLPKLEVLILEFNGLTIWQKYMLYLALFTLWWLALLLSLMAVL